MIIITDITNQQVHVAARNILAICIPSPLSSGDGQCRVVALGGLVSVVTRAEAERLVLELEAHEVHRG